MQSFIMALRSIGANKMRAVLTMLGIIIGVMALVVLVSLVNGATGSITDSVSGLGSSLLTVSIRDDKGQPVTLEDINGWMDHEADMGLIAPYSNDTVSARHSSNSGSMTVYGVTPAYYQIQGLKLSMGRWLKNPDVDNNSYICVINQTAATELIGYEDCVGQTLILNGVEYTVVGILEDDDDSLTAAFGSGSMVAYIPYTALTRLSDTVTEKVVSFYISAAEGSTLEVAQTAIEEILLERFEEDEDAFSISSQNILEEVMSDITGVLSILLGGHRCHFPDRWRHRHHEHHAGHRNRAYPGNRHPQGHWCQQGQYPDAVSHGGCGAVYAGVCTGYFSQLEHFAGRICRGGEHRYYV